MKVVGIDSSTKSTGLSYFKDGNLVFHTLIDRKHIKDADERIDEMIEALDLELKAIDPDSVFVEAQWMSRNPDTMKKLAYIVGAIRHMCLEMNSGFNSALPSQWRKDIGIKGKNRQEDKDLAVKYVSEKYGLEVNDDVAEGICIGEYGSKAMAAFEEVITEAD